jgi:hypothetical protein
MAMADNKPTKPKEAPAPTGSVSNLARAEESQLSLEPRNLTREMLAQEIGEEEARKRIP